MNPAGYLCENPFLYSPDNNFSLTFHCLCHHWEVCDLQILESGEPIGLKHFKPIKPLGSGDTGRYILLRTWPFHFRVDQVMRCYSHPKWMFIGNNLWTCSVHLVELCGTDQHFAMKAMDKSIMLNRNKVKS